MELTNRNHRAVRFSKCFASALVLLAFSQHLLGQKPSVETLKQALEKSLLSLKPQGISERNVIFQQVRVGSANNFQVTALIRDYEPGYPPNQYYGSTCVSKIDAYVNTLVPDGFGGWGVQGRLTPDEKNCKPNPSAGVSSIPLSSLAGTAAQSGPIAQSGPVGGAQEVQRAGGVALGSYECWTGSRPQPGLNFKITGAGSYTDSEGKAGSFTLDKGSQRLTFYGGMMEGGLGPGYYPMYYEPQGKPTVSVRSERNQREISVCQKVF